MRLLILASVLALAALTLNVREGNTSSALGCDIQTGWLQVSPPTPSGERWAMISNRGGAPLRYSWVDSGPAYTFIVTRSGRLRIAGPLYCANGMGTRILGPRDSIVFRVDPNDAPHGKARLSVSLMPLDTHQWFIAISDDSLEYAPPN